MKQKFDFCWNWDSNTFEWLELAFKRCESNFKKNRIFVSYP